MTNPRGSLKGLGMGVVLMPNSPAISAIGSVVDAPVRRSIKDWMGPARSSVAAVVASPEEVVVVSAEAVVVSAEQQCWRLLQEDQIQGVLQLFLSHKGRFQQQQRSKGGKQE